MPGFINMDIPKESWINRLSPADQKELMRETRKIATPQLRQALIAPWKKEVPVETGKLKKSLKVRQRSKRMKRQRKGEFPVARIDFWYTMHFQNRWETWKSRLLLVAPAIVGEALKQALINKGYRK